MPRRRADAKPGSQQSRAQGTLNLPDRPRPTFRPAPPVGFGRGFGQNGPATGCCRVRLRSLATGVTALEKNGRGSADDFDGWGHRYHEHYPAGSRLDLEFRLSRLLVLASRGWINRIDSLLRGATGQTRARWQMLFALSFSGMPVTLSDLSARLRVQWPTLVRVVEGLEKDGYVTRTDNPGDGRSRLIHLTDSGRALIATIQPILDPAREKALSRLSDEELVLCTDLLHRILEGTRAGPDPASGEAPAA
ncbi:MAG: MarR family transcriptional regulator [Sphingomonas bacterium]|nr:MarR family transcriptional regulator [Sphingomonas bacterium]MDB5717746.1 MarR family transcriptional regulator [Sphingomonas bacterium]